MTKRVKTDDKDVVCPFYNSRHVNSISCQGFYHPDSTITQTFTKKDDIFTQMQVFCKTNNYRKCELYRAIYEARFIGELDD